MHAVKTFVNTRLACWPGLALVVGAVLLMSWPSERLQVLAASASAFQAPQAETELEGDLEVLYEDAVGGARLLHFLLMDEGPGQGRGNAFGRRRVKLEFRDGAPDFQTGTRVRARGRMKDADTLELSSKQSAQAVSAIVANTFGDQRTLVILVNFQDNPTAPYTWSQAHATTFQTVSDFFRESSFTQTWLSGEVTGWHTIAMNSSGCDYNQIASLADQKASANGVNINNYPRRVYAFPGTGACGWWGLGTVGGNPSRAWINGSYALKVVAHELGHNFGDWHSHSVPCDTNGCSSVEYGDDRDMMGLSATGHFNAFQKWRLGWLAYGNSPAIQTISQSGTYQLESFSAPAGGGPKALKILKSVDGSGNKTWYYVEARTSYGFDASVASGVVIHTGADAVSNSSDQIDLDATTPAFDSTLDAGQIFTDAAIGVSISTVWANASGAAVSVSMGATPCSMGAPNVSLSPGGNVMTTPGSPVDYGVSVKNNDGSSCSDATFDLNDLVPSGWSGSLSSQSVSVAPGSTAFAGLTVTPPSTASGQNGVTVSASRPGGPGGSANGSITVVAGLDVQLSIASGRRGFEFQVTVRAGGSPVSGANVTFTLVKPGGSVSKGTATTNASGQAGDTFRPKRNDPSGTYQVFVSVSSGGLNGSAVGAFIVN